MNPNPLMIGRVMEVDRDGGLREPAWEPNTAPWGVEWDPSKGPATPLLGRPEKKEEGVDHLFCARCGHISHIGELFEAGNRYFHARCMAEALEEAERLERAAAFHPRATKLMRREKNFVVVACDEPYFFYVYWLIRCHERKNGSWSAVDEEMYQHAMNKVRCIVEMTVEADSIDMNADQTLVQRRGEVYSPEYEALKAVLEGVKQRVSGICCLVVEGPEIERPLDIYAAVAREANGICKDIDAALEGA